MKKLCLGLCFLLFASNVQAAKEHYVILASFASEAAAVQQLGQLQNQFSNASIITSQRGDNTLHRIALGPYASSAGAKASQEQATQSGINQAWMLAANQQPQARQAQPKKISQGTEKRISRLDTVFVSRFDYDIPVLNEEIAALLSSKENQTLTNFEILEVKEEINQLFAKHGYVNSGVLIPDQKIDDGVVKLEFIQGEVSDIQIQSRLRGRYISSRLDVSSPFNLFVLQQSLKALEQETQITRLDAKVSPGVKPGEANLALKVDTTETFAVSLEAANNRSPSVGSENGTLIFSSRNLTGWGETIRLGSSITQGLDSDQASLHVPITSSGASLELKYQQSNSSVIEEPFDDIDVDSETESLSLVVNLPVFRSLSTKLDAHLTLEARRNQTDLLGQPFSFSEGAINGESRVAPIRLAISYINQQMDRSLAARFSVSRGTSNFDASDAPDTANGIFTSYLAQVQYSQLLTERTHFTLRALAQYASDPLLSVEKFALGGLGSVRGYRQNQVVRDNAYLASAEWHYRFDIPVKLTFLLFAEWGNGENHDDSSLTGDQDLSSIGFGLTLADWHGISAELYFAHGLDDFTAREHDLQDDGIHFRLGYRYEF